MKRRIAMLGLALVLVASLAAVACGSPTATPEPTATVSPTSTSVPTPTRITVGAGTSTPTSPPAPTSVSPTPTKAAVPTPTSAPAAKPEGTLTVALASLDTESLDPISAGNPNKKFLDVMYDNMIGATDDGKLSGSLGLVEKWGKSADSKTWTLSVRKGVKFHNGDDLTAEDVKFTLERAMGPDATAPYAPTFKSYIGDPNNMVVKDPYTLVINLVKPYPFFNYEASILGGPVPYVVPKKYIQEKGKAHFGSHPIGSGPYKFVEQVSGNYIKFEAVESVHWRVGVPRFKNVIFRMIPEQSSRVAALKNKEVDIIEVGRERIPELKTAGFNIFMKEGGTFLLGGFIQPWEGSPLADKRVREAINLAVNKDEILEQLFMGAGTKSFGLVSSYAIGYEKWLEPYPYDPARARQLFTDAGVLGKEITIWQFSRPGTPELTKVQEAIAGYLTAAGLKTKLVPLDYAALRGRIQKDELPLPSFGLAVTTGANRLMIGGVIQFMYHPKGEFREFKDDATATKLIDDIFAAGSEEELGKTLKAFSLYEREQHLGLPTVEVSDPFATNDKVKDWKLGLAIYDFNLEYVYTRR